MVHAVALENWQRLHRFCSRCGERTVIAAAGHIRRCPACGAEHYPRTDPAVIMLVTDDQDRVLLGRQVHWPEGRFSTLAGFVEPGESIEQSVRREVFEEAGVTVGEVEYVASQPWPFPSSLMLGFMARATSSEITVDGEEIQEARWFSREELRRRLRVRRGAAAVRHLHRRPADRALVRQAAAEAGYGRLTPTGPDARIDRPLDHGGTASRRRSSSHLKDRPHGSAPKAPLLHADLLLELGERRVGERRTVGEELGRHLCGFLHAGAAGESCSMSGREERERKGQGSWCGPPVRQLRERRRSLHVRRLSK